MPETTECPICKTVATKIPNHFDGLELDCPRCSNYKITGSAIAVWNGKNLSLRQIANASSWVREHENIIINSDQTEFLSTIPTPSINDRATKILQEIAKLSSDLSYRFNLSSSKVQFWLGVSNSDNASELDYLFQTYLKEELNYIDFVPTIYTDRTFHYSEIYITPKGYAYIDSISRTANISQIGFCAMWFDENVLPIWINVISPAILDAGYDPKRVDTHHHNNRIDDEIIAMIRRSKFVVADFTGQRGGVYFEAGFALGLGLQVIWTCKKSELKDVHFDTRQYNFVTWEEDKLDEFKLALQNRIEATLGHGNLQ